MKVMSRNSAAVSAAMALAAGLVVVPADAASAAQRTDFEILRPTIEPVRPALPGDTLKFRLYLPQVPESSRSAVRFDRVEGFWGLTEDSDACGQAANEVVADPATNRNDLYLNYGISSQESRETRGGQVLEISPGQVPTASRVERTVTVADVGKTPCAFTTVYWESPSGRSFAISGATAGEEVQAAPVAPPWFPNSPYLRTGQAVFPGAGITLVGTLRGEPRGDERETLRSIRISVTDNVNIVGNCDRGRDLVDRASSGVSSIYVDYLVPANSVGKYICAQQVLGTTTSNGPKYSIPTFLEISANPGLSSVPNLNLPNALALLQTVTAELAAAQQNPQISAAARAEIAARAEAARREAEAAAQAAAQQNAGQQGNAGQQQTVTPATPAEVQAAQEVIERAAAQVNEAVQAATVGQGAAAVSMATLLTTTDFDPLATPILLEGQKNPSGISISVKTPAKAKQRKNFRATLKVNKPVTRGGMRMYFVSIDDGQVKLLHKRSGFVPKGTKSKNFYINYNWKPGTYGLLTTFNPSTPGLEGVATFDTINVVKGKKKGKGKRN